MAKVKTPRSMEPDAKLRGYEQGGYLLNASGISLFQYLFSGFLLVYYTNVLYFDAALAASIMAISKILDAVSDLFMGWILDRTKSKYGKARPWMIRMMPITVVCVFLSFWQPAGLEGTLQIIYMFVTYNLAITFCYTALLVAHNSLLGLMTLNQKSRSVAGGMHMVGANVVASLLVNSLFLKISGAIGGGDPYTQAGFAGTVAIYLVLYVIFTGASFLIVRERVGKTPAPAAAEKPVEAEKIPTMKVIKSLVTNKYWLMCVGIGILVYILMAAASSAPIYYCQYVLGNLDLQSTVSSLYTLSMLPTLFITIAFVGKLGKRNTLLLGMVISVVGWILPVVSNATIIMIVGAVLRGVGFGIAGVPVGSIVQDALTYGLWRDGFNAVGMGNAANSFSQKVGNALGTMIVGFLLSAGGFDATLAAQPASALTSIVIQFTWLPAICCLGILILAIFYDLDKKYAGIEADIKAGKIGENK